MEALVRRLQSEAILGERQLDHVVALLQEYCLFSSLYWSIRRGHLVSSDGGGDSLGGGEGGERVGAGNDRSTNTIGSGTANLLELETKSWALAHGIQTGLANIDSTMKSWVRILEAMSRLPAVTSIGLEKVLVDVCREGVPRHQLLGQEAMVVIQAGQRGELSVEQLELLITKLRLRVHWPNLGPILTAFIGDGEAAAE